MEATIVKAESPIESVTITMSEDEAQSILIVCENVGGMPELSRRGHFDNLKRALTSAGVKLPRESHANLGSIMFKERP